MFKMVTKLWQGRVETYGSLLSPETSSDMLCNVMMTIKATILRDKCVWVMNVVPPNRQNRIKLISVRGLLGTASDKTFTTYSCTYDLLYAGAVCSELIKEKCCLED